MAISKHNEKQAQYMSKAGKYFPASVVNNNDPTQNFRIQCRVAGIDASTPDSLLPWCKQMSTLATGAVTGIDFPAVGEQVWIFFPEEDGSFRYLTAKNIIANSQLKALIKNYPNGYASVDAMGTTLVVDTQTGTYDFIFPDGSHHSWTRTAYNIYGSATLNIAAAVAINMYAPTVVIGGQNVTITGSNSFNMGGAEASISAPIVSITGTAINMNGIIQSGPGTGVAPVVTNTASTLTAGTPVTPTYPPAITEGT